MSTIKKWLKKVIGKLFSFSYVLMFHHVTEEPKTEKSLCKLDFEKFKEFILRYKGHYATLSDVVRKKSKKKLAVTFDDGLADLYSLAYPFLIEQNIPFTAFIVSDFLDTEGYITTEQLKEISANPLVTIGSHGKTHNVFTALSKEDKIMELTESKRILEGILNKEINLFAYSHGQYDQETLELMKSYEYAFAAGESFFAHIKANKYLVPRSDMTTDSYNTQLAFFDNAILEK